MHSDSATELTDEKLMQNMASGDIGSLGLLYRRYRVMVLQFVRSVLVGVSPSNAEDICQEVFLTLFETASRYKESGKLRGWLFGIAVRKTRATQRKRWQRLKLFNENISKSVHLAHTVDDDPEKRSLKRQQLERIMTLLSQRHREVLMMRMGEGLSGEEISCALGISRNAVFVRLHRAQKFLAEVIEDSGEDLNR